MIQLSLLQLKDVWIDDFSIKSIYTVDDTNSPESIDMHLGTQFKFEDNADDPRIFKLTMEINFRPQGEVPGVRTHATFLKIIGSFQILPQAKEESIQNYKMLSAPSILYGMARGFIAMMTSMSRPGKFVMPSLDPRTFQNAKPIVPHKSTEPTKSPKGKTRRKTN